MIVIPISVRLLCPSAGMYGECVIGRYLRMLHTLLTSASLLIDFDIKIVDN